MSDTQEITRKLNEIGLSQVWTAILDTFVEKADLPEELIAKLQDAYTNKEIDDAIVSAINMAVSNLYKYEGSVEFQNLPTSGMKVGHTYNIINNFITDSRFTIVGESHPAGTNVAWTGDKWDCLSGLLNLKELITAQLSLTSGIKIATLNINGKTYDLYCKEYGAFKGSTTSANGTEGLVPAPTKEDVMKALCSDGSFKHVSELITTEELQSVQTIFKV